MCGLTGFCDFNKKLNKSNLISANDAIQHRGPDSSDVAVFDTSSATIGFAHRRLSILDVSSNGSQPMYSDDRSVVIILNGEVYNFKEIRRDLEALGHHFHSNSDTEVVIKAYQQFGIDSVHRFIGMFAYAIYDLKQQVVYLLRDRAGVKPLYYFHKDGCLLFASELKALYTYPTFEKEINEQAVSLFFKYGYIRAPHTIYKNTYKVQPGHCIKIDVATNKVENIKYYNVLDYYNKPKLKLSEEEAANEVEQLFTSAFQYRMVSDVPVGVFLSGGYDSTLVAGILQKNNSQRIKTFTIGFKEANYNEGPHAKKIAGYLGTDHNEYYCTTKEAQDILLRLPEIYDEPFGDSSAIPTTLVSQFARKHVTVSLSADGGDEIFAGYNKYFYLQNINNTLQKSPQALLKVTKSLSNLASGIFPALNRSHKFERASEILSVANNRDLVDVSSTFFKHKEIRDLLPKLKNDIGLYDDPGKINNENDFINTSLALDYTSYMVDDILVKVDRATMSVGLEGREPLLDHRIIEFVSQLPSNLKYNNGEKKYLLKKITHKYIPKELLDRPKTGFSIPIEDWLKTDLKHYLYDYINEEQLKRHGLIDVKKAIAIRDEFLVGRNKKENQVTQLWLILMFQMWYSKWM